MGKIREEMEKVARENAIKDLKELQIDIGSSPDDLENSPLYYALDIAIKSLEQQPCEDECIEKYEAIRRIEVRRKITCESDPYNYEEWTKGYKEGIDDAIAMINSVPSVTPSRLKGQEPRQGHWIKVTNGRGGHECDLCHEYAPSFQNGDEYLSAFCPNCGADMREK